MRAIARLRAANGGHEFEELAGHRVRVVAHGVDLDKYVGQVVDVTGKPLFGPQSATFVADRVQVSQSWFHTSGNTRVGEYLQVYIDTVGASRWYLYFAPGFDIVPLEHLWPIASGTLWLDPAHLFSVSAGNFLWRWQDRLLVPNVPSLIGAIVHFQGAIHTAPGPLLFLNAERVTILP